MEPAPQQPPQDDPAARFRRPAEQPGLAPGGNAPPNAARHGGLPAAVWFLLGAAVASAGWYGYGLMQRSMMASMAASGPAGRNVELDEFMRQAQAAAEQVAQAAAQPSAGPTGSASLDLVSGANSRGGAAGQAAAPQVFDAAKVQAVGDATANLVGSLMPLINDPKALQSIPPEKRAEYLQMQQMLGPLLSSLKSGRPLDKATEEQIRRLAAQFEAQQKQARAQGGPR